MKLVLGPILALAIASTAQAAPFDLYEQGKYEDAIAAGVARNDSAGFALAARAALAAETMRDAPCLDCLKRAEDYARKAVAADPKNPDGHVFLAVALGREGRLVGAITVLSQGFASQAKEHLDAALAADPNNAFAWAALGGWNIEIVHKGGARLARMVYGATGEQGFAAFDKAFALAPGNVALRYQYALTLSAYNPNAFRKNIEDALVRARDGKPNGLYEIFVQARAKELIAALNKGDMNAYTALVSRDQGNPP
jgi:tetratricopeptide (TPR) repeat protein